jgi:hypothetical protein
MSAKGETLYTVAMRHLSGDGKRAGVELPDAQLNHLSVRQLRSLLDAAAKLAPSVAYPAEPELRISSEAGKFVVQLKNGGLNFISWSSAVKAGGAISPAQIIAAITGESGRAVQEQSSSSSAGLVVGLLRQTFTTGLLVIAILAVNGFTYWFMTRPPRTLEPKFTFMDSVPADRLLSEVAGVYETGGGPGDRRLEIRKDGGVQRIKFGSERRVVQKQQFSVKAAQAAGKPALVTDKKTLIAINDPVSVVLYGDTYRRVPQ